MNMAGIEQLRNRGAAVIIEGDQVAVIKRNWNGREYYVFPGGGIEVDESPEQATIREVFEELGVKIAITEHLGVVQFHGMQYYFLAKIVSGIVGTGQGEEFDESRNRGQYEPMWIPIARLNALDIRPAEIAKRLYERMEI